MGPKKKGKKGKKGKKEEEAPPEEPSGWCFDLSVQ